ncbi:transcriptional regulator with XRE-family HTH domain [Nocardiopsis mwathae]|uniref:Transcriptional regulator with XRE-family HTH domain n=1 Tax=Nocardiopsis mwathae TaxID=1472723 RepID=A0A7W9YLY2_9ACTN|nr:hypothetical protein [Nocardiopsis mwathae]MBB6174597.1 transcriptional regulator with XRE-family HTH domain [Nocardiopsis mwathae]
MPRPSTDLGAYIAEVGEAVRRRREELGLDRAEFARREPTVSYRLLQAMERGERTRYSDIVLAKLERKLGWEPGSFRDMATGGDPRPIQDRLISVEYDERSGVETRMYRRERVDLVQRIYDDVEADLAVDDEFTPEEQSALLEKALEVARSQALMIIHTERRHRRHVRGRTW